MAEVLSYRDVVNGVAPKPPEPKPKTVPASTLFSDLVRSQAPPLRTHRGEPAMFISEAEEATIAEPFKFTLIGKFSWGRPPMVIIRKEIQSVGFTGPCYIGLIDSQHIVFRFEQEVDYQRMWLKRSWSFRGFKARMFKWSTEFSPEIESPIVPIWINFPMLPLHCFNKKVLFTLASAVGNPLKTDTATAAALQAIRPSVARVCVEADISKALPERVWISKGENGMWQDIHVEDKPSYCSKCRKLGHLPVECNPNSEETSNIENNTLQKKVWIPKESRVMAQKSQRIDNTNAKENCSKDFSTLPTNPVNDKGKAVKESVGCSSSQTQMIPIAHQEIAAGNIPHSDQEREKEAFTVGNPLIEIRTPKDTAIHHRIQEGRFPFIIDLQQTTVQEAPSIGGEGEGRELMLLPLTKAPSTTDLHRLQLISTESEMENQYGGSSEWEEETDSAAYMEILEMSKHKHKKSKSRKQSVPTSSRKLRSHNVFGYESR